MRKRFTTNKGRPKLTNTRSKILATQRLLNDWPSALELSSALCTSVTSVADCEAIEVASQSVELFDQIGAV